MPLNIGHVAIQAQGAEVRVYYDTSAPPGPDQLLVDGPRGYCLDVANLTGEPLTVLVGAHEVTVDPYGPGMTAAALAEAGIATRGDVDLVIE